MVQSRKKVQNRGTGIQPFCNFLLGSEMDKMSCFFAQKWRPFPYSLGAHPEIRFPRPKSKNDKDLTARCIEVKRNCLQDKRYRSWLGLLLGQKSASGRWKKGYLRVPLARRDSKKVNCQYHHGNKKEEKNIFHLMRCFLLILTIFLNTQFGSGWSQLTQSFDLSHRYKNYYLPHKVDIQPGIIRGNWIAWKQKVKPSYDIFVEGCRRNIALLAHYNSLIGPERGINFHNFFQKLPVPLHATGVESRNGFFQVVPELSLISHRLKKATLPLLASTNPEGGCSYENHMLVCLQRRQRRLNRHPGRETSSETPD